MLSGMYIHGIEFNLPITYVESTPFFFAIVPVDYSVHVAFTVPKLH